MKKLLHLLFKRKTIILYVIILIITITIGLITPPIKQAFEYNPDEGTELIKALLFQKGFLLYTEILNDQPPLFTLIISFWLKLFGASIQKARLLGTLFSIILLFCLHQIIQIKKGKLCAILTIILLLSSSVFFRLSAGLMPGIAAFSLAMISILFATLYKKFPNKSLISLSGVFIALSLHIKLCTLFLIPLILIEIISYNDSESNKKKISTIFSTLLLWFISFSIIYFSLLIVFFNLDFSLITEQLINPHTARITVGNSNFSVILKMLFADYTITILALISSFTLLFKKHWKLLFPLLWAFLSLFLLIIHKPIWHHYYIFISIPLCWLAAIRITDFFHIGTLKCWLIKKNQYTIIDVCVHWITGILIILLLFEMPHTYNKIIKSLNEKTVKQEREIINIISKYNINSQWIVTDRPIFAFYTNMLVPPELALISRKRNFSSDAAQKYFIKKLKKYTPELILINRSEFYGEKAISYVENNYNPIFKGTVPFRVWSSKSLETYPKGSYSLFKEFFTNPWFIKEKKKNNHNKIIIQTTSKKLHTLTFLNDLIHKLIAEYQKIKEDKNFSLNKNTIYPFFIDKTGTLKIKKYRSLNPNWITVFFNKQDKKLAYKTIKKEIKDWKLKQKMPADQINYLDFNLSIITRLNSFKNKITQDISKEKRMISLKSTKNTPTNRYKNIKLYLRKDILKQ